MNFSIIYLYIVYIISFIGFVLFILYAFISYKAKKAKKIKRKARENNEIKITKQKNVFVVPEDKKYFSQMKSIINNCNTTVKVDIDYDRDLENKINNENIFNAEHINNNQNYINFIINPLPSYEELAQDLKQEREMPTPNINKVINPVAPTNNNSFIPTSQTNNPIDIFNK